ncbi:hypothetical protein [Methylobacterium sp. GC_Met_2]|uniref:hypothetical protein n=1 Tax=Methylobacterium sp. GC_Met_2 TaxID=2937376 RepID=UPI00226B3F46|nr:hypothetical protein [Methylobacterium sp. GC_Met_2]
MPAIVRGKAVERDQGRFEGGWVRLSLGEQAHEVGGTRAAVDAGQRSHGAEAGTLLGGVKAGSPRTELIAGADHSAASR